MEVDWAYLRKGWQSCEKAQMYFEKNNIPINMIVSPGENPISAEEAIGLINSFKKIYVAKGKRVVACTSIYDDKQEIIKAAIGRTGNLRSPAIQIGDSLYVGYNSHIYAGL